jgi:hypothetical protein
MTGASPILGMNLISEGVGDLVSAMRAIGGNNFSWSEYAHLKALSLTISMISCLKINTLGLLSGTALMA